MITNNCFKMNNKWYESLERIRMPLSEWCKKYNIICTQFIVIDNNDVVMYFKWKDINEIKHVKDFPLIYISKDYKGQDFDNTYIMVYKSEDCLIEEKEKINCYILMKILNLYLNTAVEQFLDLVNILLI